MIHAAFAVPGALETPTGGYAYARRLLAEASGAGMRLDHIALPDGFPHPGSQAVRRALAQLAAVPAGRPLLVDGLAFGTLPAAVLCEVAAPLAVLLHHPLGLETGLSPAEAGRMLATEAAALRHAGAVIVPSRSGAEVVAAQLGVPVDRITVAPPGLDPVEAPRGPREPGTILCVGTLSPRKGQDVLVAALERLQDRDWRAVLVGATDRVPGHAARLRALIAQAGIADRVTITGDLPAEALAEAYAGAALFCLPSRHEGYGMVFAEAMANGLPVIAADIPAAREVMPPEARLLVPSGDACALAEALGTLLGDQVRCEAMAAAGRNHAACLPDWAQTARTVADVLRGLTP